MTPTATPSGATPSASASAAPTSAPSPVSSQQGGGKGCSQNGVPIPSGAATATIADVDETDSDATEFYAEQPHEFGVHTKSGATVAFRDDLVGGGTHSGWTARLDLAVVAVLDDGRAADLYSFVNCRFVQPKGVDGKPYTFLLAGFGTAGTGVGCSSYVDGARKLVGLNAVKLANGRYRIDSTEVRVAANGLTATNGATTRGTTTYAADSPQVRAANTSTCGDVPKAGSRGE
ncbi:hypothetical protein [Amnibacterium setariae]|uniref:hypothetical protein n=1 Tax=Amnibacterium setariae TaxID=2306585 RepID=UPI0011C375E7|nr:hypothetical protein [Amnibacterium setariae]